MNFEPRTIAEHYRMKTEKTQQKRKAIGVEAKAVCKRFGKQEVLRKVSFEVRPRETFVIMGPSGAGKSVLLKTIMGLQLADSGQVLIDGCDASEEKTHQKYVTSIVFQAGALFNSLSVFDNLALYPREHRLYDSKTIARKVERILEILSLKDAAGKMPSELSGGMRKRVAIARALMMEPQLLLYDEPTSELDPVSSATIAEIIATLKEEYQVTSIVVTHDRELALNVGDRIAMMFDGTIYTVGTTDEIKNSDDKKVRNFLNPRIDVENPRFRG